MPINHEDLVRSVIDECLSGSYVYVYEHEDWLHWDGARWAPHPRHEVRAVIGDWAYQKYLDARRASDTVNEKFWSAVCSYESQQALTDLAEGHLLHYANDFNRDSLLLNCANVTVNLATGEAHEHDPADLLTRVTPVNYYPDAVHSDWIKALSALPDELLDWYQLRMGQAITGKMTPDGRILFQLGNGHNGKSAVLDTIRFTLGDGYCLLASRAVLSGSSSDMNPALAVFRDKRLAMIEELEDGHHLSTTALKDLADTATISARQPHKLLETFDATHSLFVNSNYNLSISEVDDGTWRRIVVVRFPYKYERANSAIQPPNFREPDPGLKERLRTGAEQREACLAWLVAGAVAFHTADGAKAFYDVPSLARAQTRAVRADTDLMMAFIEERIVFDPAGVVRQSDLQSDYNTFAEKLGHKPLSARQFNSRFEGHALVTPYEVTRGEKMRPGALAKVVSYPAGKPPFDAIDPAKDKEMVRVWKGFRFKANADYESEAELASPRIGVFPGQHSTEATEAKNTPISDIAGVNDSRALNGVIENQVSASNRSSIASASPSSESSDDDSSPW